MVQAGIAIVTESMLLKVECTIVDAVSQRAREAIYSSRMSIPGRALLLYIFLKCN